MMIIDSCDDFRDVLYQKLKDEYSVHPYSNGNDALEAVKAINPDIIVADLILSGIDGLSLLNEIQKMGLTPATLVTTRLFNDYINECTEKLGISYIILKPCSPASVVQRVRNLSSYLKAKAPPDPNTLLYNRMLELRLSPRHKGFDYLREAVLIKASNPDATITKELYPAVSTKYQSTPMQVERSIRSAVNSAWELKAEGTWDTLLPLNSLGIMERPSNGVLIACLSDELRTKLGK